MEMIETEFWYCIARYEWAKERGLLKELFPVVTPPNRTNEDTDDTQNINK